MTSHPHEANLSEDECVTRVLLATRGRIIHTLRGLPSAVPTRICLVNGALLFTGDGEVLDAACRHDVLSIQIDDATVEAPTWSVVVTGRAQLAPDDLAPSALRASLPPGAALLMLPLTLLYGRREF